MEKWFTYDFNGNGFEFYQSRGKAEEAAKSYMKEAIEELGIDGIVNEKIYWGELVIKGSLKIQNDQAIMADTEE